MKPDTRDEYLRRVTTVIEYIMTHLDNDLDIQTLANYSHLSPFHFHRIFKAFTGESLASFITRVRLYTAAKLLRSTKLPVKEVAYTVGYEVPSSLSKAFKQQYKQAPVTYRKNQNNLIEKLTCMEKPKGLGLPKILELPAKKAIFISLNGNYETLDYAAAWSKLWNHVSRKRLFSAGIEHLGMSFDDPKLVPENCRYDACLVVHKPAEPEDEVNVKEIDGGTYAKFPFQGSYDRLNEVYEYIYSVWLPDSGYELRNVPGFDKYVSNPNRVEPSKLKTEIYLPISLPVS